MLILLLALLKLRCKLRCKLREIVQDLDNFALHLKRRDGDENIGQSLRRYFNDFSSMRKLFLLSKKILRLKPIRQKLSILIMANNGCMASNNHTVITQPSNTFTNVFNILARYCHQQVAMIQTL